MLSDLPTQAYSVIVAVLLVLAFYVGTKYDRPDAKTKHEEWYRLRYKRWLERLWHTEEKLAPYSLVIAHHPAAGGPHLVHSPTVYSDIEPGILPWVIHTNNLSSVRLAVSEKMAVDRGTKFDDEHEEQTFQRIMRTARFLSHITHAALTCEAQDYQSLRPALLDMMIRYPNYVPEDLLPLNLKKAQGYQCLDCRRVFLEQQPFEDHPCPKRVNGSRAVVLS